MQVGSQKLGDKVAVDITDNPSELSGVAKARHRHSHVLQGRDEDVAQGNDLQASNGRVISVSSFRSIWHNRNTALLIVGFCK